MNRTFKRITQYVTVIALTAMLASPASEARGRNNGSNSTQQRREQTSRPASRGNSGDQSRPSRSSRPASAPARPGNGANRPGSTGSTTYRPNTNAGGHTNKPAHAVKPDNKHNTSATVNGNHNNNGYRPGNNGNHNGNHNNGNHNGNHNGNSHRPGYRPGNRPGNGYHPGYKPAPKPSSRPGHRPRPPYHQSWRPPMAPPPRPYFRPAPPPRAWRPTVVWPTFHTVLGVNFGTALNVSLNLLLNNGYTVDAYGNDCIYLSNVPMLNCYWPDATLYYGNNGLLSGSFVYSSGVYDMNRYNNVYSMLTANYGTPYQINNNGASISATWWGGNQFITLTYNNAYANNGSLRYFTTLTFGN